MGSGSSGELTLFANMKTERKIEGPSGVGVGQNFLTLDNPDQLLGYLP